MSCIEKWGYSVLHFFLFSDWVPLWQTKVTIYCITSTVMPFVLYHISATAIIRDVIKKSTKNKALHDDLFKDFIDYDGITRMSIHLKDSDVYYIGRFRQIEEKGLDSVITLVNYEVVSKATNQVIPSMSQHNSLLVLCRKDIERIEVIYTDDSKVWERLHIARSVQH